MRRELDARQCREGIRACGSGIAIRLDKGRPHGVLALSSQVAREGHGVWGFVLVKFTTEIQFLNTSQRILCIFNIPSRY